MDSVYLEAPSDLAEPDSSDESDFPELEGYEKIMEKKSKKDWKTTEAKCGFGYSGHGESTLRRKRANEWKKVEESAKMRKTPQAEMMRQFVRSGTPRNVAAAAVPIPALMPVLAQEAGKALPSTPGSTMTLSMPTSGHDGSKQLIAGSSTGEAAASNLPDQHPLSDGDEVFTGYLSDLENIDDESVLEDELSMRNDNLSDVEDNNLLLSPENATVHAPGIPPIPEFHPLPVLPPPKCCKHVVTVHAARAAAQAEQKHELSEALVIIDKLLRSKRTDFMRGNGLQAKRAHALQSYLMLVVKKGKNGMDASAIAAEAQGFSAKWGSHLDFSQQKMIPAASKAYLQTVLEDEMPKGLKQYMEHELFPHIHLSPGKKGVSLTTCCSILAQEGFQYTEHAKGMYYDGHERPDVVVYRQDTFIPQLMALRPRVIEYVVSDVDKEVQKIPPNYVERRVALVVQDEMTCQQNDGAKSSWILDGKSLEYGKNYEGYWTGEMFIDQLRDKIIPALEARLGPGIQAAFLIDNSQGHAAYPKDVLLTSRMNL
ncbi:hypothetical protein FISHEDRAFT_58593 [Fistulina hepatica ATCC 64428]|uniref:DDE-1 domain-containing protein n=1 Tax=Fistulina hepatica ATCC 64428 TaxID=1128425 RepID=A0A0D7ADL6_9AGAR|nr:hypothetical protein FISHEDRAFT_58593 [Fistulina hepatica ATCC 64428]